MMYDISVDIGEGQERFLDELDPMAHDLGFKSIADTISFDIGAGEDKGVMSVYDIKMGKYEFGVEVSEHSLDILRVLFGLSNEFNAQSVAVKRLLKAHNEYVEWVERFCSLARKGKHRKTTYKTIRRDCAKRNRHK